MGLRLVCGKNHDAVVLTAAAKAKMQLGECSHSVVQIATSSAVEPWFFCLSPCGSAAATNRLVLLRVLGALEAVQSRITDPVKTDFQSVG